MDPSEGPTIARVERVVGLLRDIARPRSSAIERWRFRRRPAAHGSGGRAGPALSTAELAAIAAFPRAYYVNVHTNNFPGGEVRGQLK
jgi:hypothetical protein